jgi:site-specific recombinase XerD
MRLVQYQDELEFGTGTASLAEFEAAFERWLEAAEQQLRQPSSIEVYRHMWAAFAHWCVSRREPLRLDALRQHDLDIFLASRSGMQGAHSDLSPRYAWRMLSLIDRVLAVRARERDAAHNAAARELIEARPEVRYANAAEEALPDYLLAAEAKRLVTFLSQLRPRSYAPGSTHTWQELRDRTSVGLQLGGGLTPGDVRVLTTASPVSAGGRLKGVPWKIVVPAYGASASRETPLAQWAGQLLRYWLQTREALGLPAGCAWLFPSTRTGKPWGKVAQYEAVKRVLADAGVEPVEGGSFRLRHTFALRQLRRGRPPEEVARWLGVVDPAVIARYQRVLTAPVDDVV